MALQITDSNINEVLASCEFVVIDFWAEWCAPCRALGPVIESISKDANPFIIGKLNVTENPASMEKYGIRSLPTIIIFKNGEPVDGMKGLASKFVILNKIKAKMTEE